MDKGVGSEVDEAISLRGLSYYDGWCTKRAFVCIGRWWVGGWVVYHGDGDEFDRESFMWDLFYKEVFLYASFLLLNLHSMYFIRLVIVMILFSRTWRTKKKKACNIISEREIRV